MSMIGNFDDVPPTPIQLRTVGRLLGWRLGIDGVDPKGTVQLESAGSHYTTFPAGSVATLPTIFTHRDVGNTDCPGNAAYALMTRYGTSQRIPTTTGGLIKALQGGAIYDHWQAIGGMNSVL
ncbi:N-acetylmuramoyl-L-alanine amidase family protein, partial [Mycobacterium intracellulare MIN_061107_1834]